MSSCCLLKLTVAGAWPGSQAQREDQKWAASPTGPCVFTRFSPAFFPLLLDCLKRHLPREALLGHFIQLGVHRWTVFTPFPETSTAARDRVRMWHEYSAHFTVFLPSPNDCNFYKGGKGLCPCTNQDIPSANTVQGLVHCRCSTDTD